TAATGGPDTVGGRGNARHAAQNCPAHSVAAVPRRVHVRRGLRAPGVRLLRPGHRIVRWLGNRIASGRVARVRARANIDRSHSRFPRNCAAMTMLPGSPHPLGATWDGEGVNFALYSEHASGIELCLFDETGSETRFALSHRTAFVWHAYLPGIRPGQR